MVLGVLTMVFVTFLWGVGLVIPPLVKIPAVVYVFYRFLFAIPFMYLLARGKGFKKPNFKILIAGSFLAGNWIALFWSIEFIDIASADLIYYTGPVIALILSPVFLKVKNPWWVWISASLSFLGVFLMYRISTDLNPIGVVLALLGGFQYAMLIILGNILSKEYHPFVAVFYQMFVGIAITSPFPFIFKHDLNLFKISLLVVAGFMLTSLSISLWYFAMRRISVRLVSILAYLDPVFAALTARVAFGQPIDLSKIVAGILIIGSGIFSVLMERREP